MKQPQTLKEAISVKQSQKSRTEKKQEQKAQAAKKVTLCVKYISAERMIEFKKI